MQPLRKGFCFLVAVVALAGTAMMITSTATTHWVWSYVVRNSSTNPDDYGRNRSPDPNDRGGLYGSMYFGLFNGISYLNWGGGLRTDELSSFDYLSDTYNIGLWISVIVFCILAIIMGAVTTVFATYNACVVPVNMVTGIFGLYLWTGSAALLSGIAMVLFIVEYYISLIDGILSDEHYDDRWRSQWVHFGYSFWLVVASFCVFIFNAIFVKLASLGHDEDIHMPSIYYHEESGKKDMGLDLMY
ncbi:clarin-2-like [Ptychodera flava]|uniref:clarin-2-like n=1 Tax=Ptychodera flava TaxID=63121 RepID=UPI00396A2DEB